MKESVWERLEKYCDLVVAGYRVAESSEVDKYLLELREELLRVLVIFEGHRMAAAT